MQKFSELPYTRPDIAAAVEEYKRYSEAFKAAKTFEEAKKVFLDAEKLDTHLSTIASLCSIRNTMNTTDEFYEAEMAYLNENLPNLIPAEKAMKEDIVNGPFRADFEKEYGAHFIAVLENDLKTQDERIIPELVKESELSVEYSKAAASCKVDFRGETCNFYGLLKHMESTDREERKEAFEKWANLYEGVSDKLDELYDKLIEVRVEMAKKLGYDNYTELAYRNMGRLDYTPEHVEKFREQIRTVITPAVDRMRKAQAKRLGLDSVKYYDESLTFAGGNADPIGGKDYMVGQATEMYGALSPETKEFFDFMTKYELFDLETRPGKHLGGYCTSLPEYKAPFIFSNFNGTSADVDVLTHEAGHAFAAWLNRDRIPQSYIWPSLEACEVHSMSMEFFAWPWAEGFFGEDTRKFRYSHLAGALTFIPYGTMVDHFQHIVYEKPEMTPAERHAVWKELLGVYMPWMQLGSEIPFYGDGEGWQRQLHIYVNPFYYIDYCLAQTVALQFWARIQKDKDDAWKHYMAYTRQGGSRVFTELLKNADLDSPFEESCLRGVCEEAKAWLDSYDLTGIA